MKPGATACRALANVGAIVRSQALLPSYRPSSRVSASPYRSPSVRRGSRGLGAHSLNFSRRRPGQRGWAVLLYVTAALNFMAFALRVHGMGVPAPLLTTR